MSDRTVALTTIRGGLSRLRTKGAALNDSLYDLLNGYVTAARTIKVRPGTFRAFSLPEGTVGLTAANDRLNVFTTDPALAGTLVDSAALVDVYGHLVTHPNQLEASGGSNVDITEVHYAEKFMGFIYAAVEFNSAQLNAGEQSTYHFWLQEGAVWIADTNYSIGDIVQPSDFSGLYYTASRLTAPYPSWSANEQHEVGDIREPTVPNGYYYTVTEVFGANPRSGATEPVWIAIKAHETIEDTEATFDGLAAPATQPSTFKPAPVTAGRYSNIQGGNVITNG